MNYNKPDLIEQLAAEYVLGTMKGRARKRFTKLMAEHQWIRAAVWSWEEQITPLAESVNDVQPSSKVWKNIFKSIGTSSPVKQQRGSLWFWQGLSALSTALSVVLLALLLTNPTAIPQNEPNYISVVNNETAQPLWLISANIETGEINFKAVNATATQLDKAFELWMLPTDDSPPRSLGLLPVDHQEVSINLPPALKALLTNAKGLAVSLEPAGGSTTGLPTGPVLYQAPLLSL